MKDNRTPIAVEDKLITKYKEDTLTVKEPSDSLKRMNAVDAKICRDVINNIRAKKYADCNYLFLDPVDTTFFPTYTKVVRKPMDLGTAARNLEAGIYNNRQEFFSDLELWNYATRMQRLFTNVFIFQRSNGSFKKAKN